MAKGIDTEKIFKAKQDLTHFLREHPELHSLQNEIDEMLRKAGNDPANRNAAIQAMMIEFVRKLNTAFQEIKALAEPVEKVVLRSVKDSEDIPPE